MRDQHIDDGQNGEAWFWEWVRWNLSVGQWAVARQALFLYHAARDAQTPAEAQAIIHGALCRWMRGPNHPPAPLYDGDAEDVAVVEAALAATYPLLPPQVRAGARRAVDDWFGTDPRRPSC